VKGKDTKTKETTKPKKPKKVQLKGNKKRAVRPKRTEELKKIQEKIKKKKKHPTIRGRFGNKNVRRISNKKWQKWRKPRGIDINRKMEDGAWPRTGYKVENELRFRHPSGYYTEIVNNVKEVELIAKKKETAAIIAGTVGKKKRKELLKKAEEKGVVILNR